MSKTLAALLLGIKLFGVLPAYAMDSDDEPKMEEALDFDMKALLLSGFIAFIGLALDQDIPADVPQP